MGLPNNSKVVLAYTLDKKLNGAITMYEGYRNHQIFYDDSSKKMDQNVKKRMLDGRDITPQKHADLLSKRQDHQLIFKNAMADFDVLITPTIIEPAPKLDEIDEDFTPGYFTRPFNYIDMSALALPTAYTSNGLPTSLQIVVPAGQEDYVIQMGKALQSALELNKKPNLTP